METNKLQFTDLNIIAAELTNHKIRPENIMANSIPTLKDIQFMIEAHLDSTLGPLPVESMPKVDVWVHENIEGIFSVRGQLVGGCIVDGLKKFHLNPTHAWMTRDGALHDAGLSITETLETAGFFVD